MSLCQVSPDLDFWSGASDVGWGAHLDQQVTSCLWASHQAALSINARELLTIQLGLLRFQSSLRGRTVAVYCDNVTAVAYLRKEGGTRSPLLNAIAQEILRWLESLSIRLAPQFIPGSNNVLADALSRLHQLPHSEWSLNMTVFLSLCRLWPVQIDLFATSANHRCSIYFSPYRDLQSAGMDAFLQSWDGLQAYAFPPFSIIPRVLAKLRERSSLLWLRTGLSALGSRTCSSCRWLLRSFFQTVPTSCACLDLGFSTRVSASSGFMPEDSPAVHQGCRIPLDCSGAVFSSAPPILSGYISTSLVGLQVLMPRARSFHFSAFFGEGGRFPLWLRSTRGLSVSSIRGYRSVLSAVFRFHLPSLSSDPVLRDLLRSFQLSSVERVLRPPAWDLSRVLRYLNSPEFEPLPQASLRALSLKTLFLLALATAKRVSELQALSSIVTIVTFLVRSLSDFAAGLDDDLLLCPVRALRIYLQRIRSLSPLRHRFFVSPRCPSCAMSKNAVSFLREVIHAAGASRPEVGAVRAHEVCSVSTSVAFHRNWSVSSVFESAT